ncbi:MAG TPA: lipid-binding SYLF domain-containing protein [Xanthomonadaceae bacterium]|nr:lipid-binding SYLF domain-containing protein [Xanthomonadaceae bacterium]
MRASTRRRLGLLIVLLLTSAAAVAGPAEDARAREAARVLDEIQQVPDLAIPERLFDEAHAIVVVPDMLKIGFVFGGRHGRGLLSVKSADGTWSNPSFVTLTGGSIGFQAGVQSSDLVLVFRSARGLDSIVNGKFTLGAAAGVAAGPVGRNASAATDAEMKAEIWSWSRARGLFAGVAIDGAVLAMDHRANQAVYGAGNTPRMIFEGRASGVPTDPIVDFRDRLEEATAAARAARTGSAPARATPATSTRPSTDATHRTPEVRPASQTGPARTEPLPAKP